MVLCHNIENIFLGIIHLRSRVPNGMIEKNQDFSEIKELLRQSIGLNPDSLGKHLLQDAVHERMKKSGISNLANYALKVRTDPTELASLIDNVIVPESWFFRDGTPFYCLEKYANHWKTLGFNRKLRLLSIPCCTGEEPYSMAIWLQETGFESGFEILGVDISKKLLEKARDGIFGANSFREKKLPWNSLPNKYFSKKEKYLHLSAQIKKLVSFQTVNLAEPSFLAGEAPFDVIFCRNVVIYLDENHRKKTLKRLGELLSPEGILYVGHTETRLASQNNFENWMTEFPAAFCKRKNLSQSFPLASLNSTKTASVSFTPKPTVSSPIGKYPQNLGTKVPNVAPKSKSLNLFELAQQKANLGLLDEALEICNQLAKMRVPKTAFFILWGSILLAKGNLQEAEVAFRKALYLEPDHEEALSGLLAIATGMGDKKNEENYTRRLREINRGNPPHG